MQDLAPLDGTMVENHANQREGLAKVQAFFFEIEAMCFNLTDGFRYEAGSFKKWTLENQTIGTIRDNLISCVSNPPPGIPDAITAKLREHGHLKTDDDIRAVLEALLDLAIFLGFHRKMDRVRGWIPVDELRRLEREIRIQIAGTQN